MICDAVQHNQIELTEGNSGTSPSCIATSVGFFIGDNMKQIPLTQGKFALVDSADYEKLSKYKWHVWHVGVRFYATRNVAGKDSKQKTIRMHRAILNTPAGMGTDHRNHNGLDNRKRNLRECTHSQNAQNQKSQRNCSSIYKGVSWNKASKKWLARIKLNSKSHYLGCFTSEVEAARAYDIAAKKCFGEFTCLNFSK